MFITNSRRGYSKDGEQLAAGQFLVLFGSKKEGLYGIVRHVSMRQCGQFMGGTLHLGDQEVSLSGTYGGDGLPLSLYEVRSWNRGCLTKLPPEIEEAYWKGEGGHNSAGSEGLTLHEWGKALLKSRQPQASVKKHLLRGVQYCRDLDFDSREVYLPGISTGSLSSHEAAVGSMIGYKVTFVGGTEGHATGLVMGRVTGSEDVAGRLVVMELHLELGHMYIRLIDPKNVTQCGSVPAAFLSMLAGLTPEVVRERASEVVKLSNDGYLSDSGLRSNGNPLIK
jgi:hypothetical protein